MLLMIMDYSQFVNFVRFLNERVTDKHCITFYIMPAEVNLKISFQILFVGLNLIMTIKLVLKKMKFLKFSQRLLDRVRAVDKLYGKLYSTVFFVCFFTQINVHWWNIIEMPKINGGRHYGLRKEAPYAKANARLILQPLRMKAKNCLRLSKETGWPSLTKFSCPNL